MRSVGLVPGFARRLFGLKLLVLEKHLVVMPQEAVRLVSLDKSIKRPFSGFCGPEKIFSSAAHPPVALFF